jgi:hypothetical protein
MWLLPAPGAGVSVAPPLPSFAGSGYTAMLHVVGKGLPLQAGIKLGGLVTVTETTEAVLSLMFGASLPTARFGTGLARVIKLHHIMRSSTAGLDGVLAAARAGSTLCFRDKTGLLVYCVPAITRQRTNDVWGIGGPAQYEEDLELAEVAFTYVP